MVYSVVGKRIKLKEDRCNSACRKAPPADRGLAEVKELFPSHAALDIGEEI
jgi:hypothetical protein